MGPKSFNTENTEKGGEKRRKPFRFFAMTEILCELCALFSVFSVLKVLTSRQSAVTAAERRRPLNRRTLR